MGKINDVWVVSLSNRTVLISETKLRLLAAQTLAGMSKAMWGSRGDSYQEDIKYFESILQELTTNTQENT